MRSDPRAYDCLAPTSLSEALTLLSVAPGKLRPLAGGTDLMVLFAMGRLADTRLLGLWRIRELHERSADDTHVTLGALTTYTQIQSDPLLRSEFPLLCAAAAETGGLAIQNRGTLGGNVANASPAADSSPALLAYDAEIELASVRGRRWVPYATFHTGYKKTVMTADELITRIRLPRTTVPRTHHFHKVGPRRAQAISKVCLAAVVGEAANDPSTVRIALGGVAPVVVRCPRTEAAIAARDLPAARAALAHEITPIDDIRSTARYRLAVAQNLLGSLFTH